MGASRARRPNFPLVLMVLLPVALSTALPTPVQRWPFFDTSFSEDGAISLPFNACFPFYSPQRSTVCLFLTVWCWVQFHEQPPR